MANLSDFDRYQIVGSRMAGANVTKTAELFSVARSSVSKVMTAFEKEGKTSSLKQNSRRKRKIFDRNRRSLTRVDRIDHLNTTPNITVEFDNYLENKLS